ncbi:hypothetical protein M0813_21578 [Anaeramoeba flamelloides]|uniref:Uncharacterized protein n=1 Tax=Anaeramoeba flamelloides TaxID=1746091 RepID=A0ABQ8YI84_9EUKA|nr:hypothetical protein M0813_21578 [Anaeramoeba flamelloides]
MGDFFSKEGDLSLISDVFDQGGDEGEAFFLVKNLNSLGFCSIEKKETTIKLNEKKQSKTEKKKKKENNNPTTDIQIMPVLVPLSKGTSLKNENVNVNEKEDTKQVQQKEDLKKKQQNKEMVTNQKTKNSDLLKPIETNQENNKKKEVFLVSEREEDLIEQEITPDRFEFGRTSSDGFFDETDESELNSFISDNVISGMDSITSYYSQDGNNFNNKEFEGGFGVIKLNGQEQVEGQLYLSEKHNFKFGLDPDWNFVGQQTQLILEEEDLIENEIEANDNQF